MRVVFLDVDGVLNCSTTRETVNGCGIGIQSDLVKRLAKIVKRSNSEIVLVSTWKLWWSKDGNHTHQDSYYLDECLQKYGLKIYDKTSLQCSHRGEGISLYLKENGDITDWVVLDDEIFDDYEKYGIMPHLVKTDFYNGGLLESHIDEALKKLGKT